MLSASQNFKGRITQLKIEKVGFKRIIGNYIYI